LETLKWSCELKWYGKRKPLNYNDTTNSNQTAWHGAAYGYIFHLFLVSVFIFLFTVSPSFLSALDTCIADVPAHRRNDLVEIFKKKRKAILNLQNFLSSFFYPKKAYEDNSTKEGWDSISEKQCKYKK